MVWSIVLVVGENLYFARRRCDNSVHAEISQDSARHPGAVPGPTNGSHLRPELRNIILRIKFLNCLDPCGHFQLAPICPSNASLYLRPDYPMPQNPRRRSPKARGTSLLSLFVLHISHFNRAPPRPSLAPKCISL